MIEEIIQYQLDGYSLFGIIVTEYYKPVSLVKVLNELSSGYRICFFSYPLVIQGYWGPIQLEVF